MKNKNKYTKEEKKLNNKKYKIKNNNVLLTKNKALVFFLKLLKKSKIQKLDIYEELGFMEPWITAILLPIISIITLIPLHLYDIEWSNFNYQIVPQYTDLNLKLIIKTQFSFKIIHLFIV